MTKERPKLDPKVQSEIVKYLKSLPPPVAAPASAAMRSHFETVVLPVLKAQALSELQRNNEFKPRIISFMDDGSIGIVDVSSALGGNWGTAHSKETTARVHRFSTMVPGVNIAVFCVEAWSLRKDKPTDEDLKMPTKSIHDHPDRTENMMFTALHYERETGEMMQLVAFIEVIKVLGARPSSEMWRHTKYGGATIIDPMSPEKDGMAMKGRFVAGDPDNGPIDPKNLKDPDE